MATQISEFIDAIITNPNDTIEVNDIVKDFPDWKKLKVQNFMVRAKQLGYVEPVGPPATGKNPQKYKVLKRIPYISGHKYGPRKKIGGKTIRQRVIDIISAHPEDMITTDDVFKHLKDANKSTLKVTFARDMVNLGYIKPLKGAYVKNRRRYEILKRDAIKSVSREETKKALDELDQKVGKMEKEINEKILEKYINNLPTEKLMNLLNDATVAQIGKFIVFHIENLQRKIQEMSSGYSDLQGELRKEKDSAKITISSLNKKITDLNSQIRILKDKVRELDRGGSGSFKLGDMVSFKK